MEGPEDKISQEQLKQAWVKRLLFFFPKVLEANNQVMILGFLNNLSDSILAGLAQGFTRSAGFEKSKRVQLSASLNTEKSSEAREKILLEALADKERCGLEEEFLEKLREVK